MRLRDGMKEWGALRYLSWFGAKPAGLCVAALAGMLASVATVAPAAAAPSAVTVRCTSSPCQASLIQSAIDSAAPGSTIRVGAGAYLGDITIGKSVTLLADGPVTVDGQNSATSPGTTVLVNPSSVAAVIDGFTITGGYADTSLYWGGGISNNGTLTLRNDVLKGNNGANEVGGGIYNNTSGQLTVSDTVITANTSAFGGGIGNYGGLALRDSEVTDNSAESNGAGLDNAFGSGATISDVLFNGNRSTSGLGGAITNYETTLTVDSSAILNNSAADGGGVYNWPGTSPASTLYLRNDAIAFNAPNNCAGDASC
jgi:hypothetical protein